MPTVRTSANEENEDIIAYIEERGNRAEKSLQVPTPEGRPQGGWVLTQNLKVTPEMFTQMERLREHPALRGKWKTNTQVAWSMICLGLYNMREFLPDDGSNSFVEFKSAHRAMNAANEVFRKRQEQKILQEATDIFKSAALDELKKGTAYGKYAAWKAITKAIEARDSVEDVQAFDKLMRLPIGSSATPLIVSDEVSVIWSRLFPVIGGSLNEDNEHTYHDAMTQPYYDELDAIRVEEQGDGDEG